MTRVLVRRALGVLLAAMTVLSVTGAIGGSNSGASTPTAPAGVSPVSPSPLRPVPLLAYFYQWFDPSSWGRAKVDYPQLGRYSSDNTSVMRQQIEWAKQAGIDGFIVSWKSSDVNNRRLRALMDVAAAEKFKLAMIYQGLDFSRKPLAATRVAADFKLFEQQFAPNPVFVRMGGKPLTIWSGTWAYSAADVHAVTAPVRNSMLVLSTEKSVQGYQRIAADTDGDAYYWSSVDPSSNSNYATKLDQMAQAVHADHKYWLAPFAPGFDARLVGGEQSVDRRNGDTLRTEYAAALASSPDALGLISWNEFSENTYVEPSEKYGTEFLQVLGNLTRAAAPITAASADSSQAAPRSDRDSLSPEVLGAFAFLLLVLISLPLFVRSRRRRRPGPPPTEQSNSRHVAANVK